MTDFGAHALMRGAEPTVDGAETAIRAGARTGADALEIPSSHEHGAAAWA